MHEWVKAVSSVLSFRHAVWLFPAAFTLHVIEERPAFTQWARKYASDLFTQRDYDKIHFAGIVSAFVLAAVVSHYPNVVIVFLFFAFILAPGLFFNTFFHAGASLMTREYCPGVVTALMVYLPVFFFIAHLAWRESLINAATLPLALVVAAAFHTWEVGHNVFKTW
jgi:hypothetical protein